MNVCMLCVCVYVTKDERQKYFPRCGSRARTLCCTAPAKLLCREAGTRSNDQTCILKSHQMAPNIHFHTYRSPALHVPASTYTYVLVTTEMKREKRERERERERERDSLYTLQIRCTHCRRECIHVYICCISDLQREHRIIVAIYLVMLLCISISHRLHTSVLTFVHISAYSHHSVHTVSHIHISTHTVSSVHVLHVCNTTLAVLLLLPLWLSKYSIMPATAQQTPQSQERRSWVNCTEYTI